MVASQKKRKEALEACKSIESEMNDFKNNKDSKLKELKVYLFCNELLENELKMRFSFLEH